MGNSLNLARVLTCV